MKRFECEEFRGVREGERLIEKRKLTKKGETGMRARTGGNCEKRESIEQALLRELDEELSIKPINYHYVCTLFHPSEEFQKIHYFAILQWSGEIQNNEAESLSWCSLDEIELIDISADRVAACEYRRVFERNSLNDNTP